MARLKHHAGKVTALVLVLVLVGVGVFLLSGGYDRWRSGRLLSNACDGILPAEDIRAVLGDRHLKDGGEPDHVEGNLDDKKTSLRVECDIERAGRDGEPWYLHNGTVRVTVDGTPTTDHEERGDAYGLYPAPDAELPPAPLGQGWNGTLAVHEDYGDAKAVTSVLLDCHDKRSDLLVTATVEQEDVSLDNPKTRLSYARIATAAAANANRHWECGAELGRQLTSIPLPVNEDEHIPLAAAQGTCAGIPRGGTQVATAWESKSDTVPYEECVLGDAEGHALYELTANYGPYAEDARFLRFERNAWARDDVPPPGARKGQLDNGGLWTSATCPDNRERAFFTLVPRGSDTRDRQAASPHEQAILETFAERSAAAHDCKAPAIP
ncbi:hypothetical protein [Streptomyces sp. NPDC002851]